MLNKSLWFVITLLFTNLLQAESLSGKLQWADKIHYGFAVDGLLEQLNVKPGETVRASQLMAQLEAKPFEIKIQKMQARLDQLKPRLFDAKLELDRARELFDRTVLSEIELLKIETVYKGLQAEESAAIADLRLARYEKAKSYLQAKADGRVVDVRMQPGDVINAYNRGQKYIELVADDSMLAVADISISSARHIKQQSHFRVRVDDQVYDARWHELSAGKKGDYRLKVRFKRSQNIPLVAGMDVEIEYGDQGSSD